MHLAAALGVPVTAIFGPTDERVTAPLGDHDVLVHQVFCRPCMLRDCPIDHRCMKGSPSIRVFDAVDAADRPSCRAEPSDEAAPCSSIATARCIEEAGYLDRLDRLVFFPFSVDAVRLLNRAGFAVVVDHEPVRHRPGHVSRSVRRRGASASSPSGWRPAARTSTASTTARIIRRPTIEQYRQDCDCRKPAPGMLRAAAGISISICRARSWSATTGHDVQAGQRRRRAGLLVRTGYGRRGSGAATPASAGRDRRQPDRGRRVDSATGMKRDASIVTGDRLLALVDDVRRRPRRRASAICSPTSSSTAQIARVSREAPVLILDYDSTEIVPGGAGNAANNVAALGGDARSPIGVAGRDETGPPAARRRCASASTCGTSSRTAGYCARRPRRASSPAASTPPSSRSCASIARRVQPMSDEVVRDVRLRAAVRGAVAVRRAAGVRLRHRAGHAGARRAAQTHAARAGHAGSRRCWSIRATRCCEYRGMTACTPNESEVEQLLGITHRRERARARARRPRAAEAHRAPRRC